MYDVAKFVDESLNFVYGIVHTTVYLAISFARLRPFKGVLHLKVRLERGRKGVIPPSSMMFLGCFLLTTEIIDGLNSPTGLAKNFISPLLGLGGASFTRTLILTSYIYVCLFAQVEYTARRLHGRRDRERFSALSLFLIGGGLAVGSLWLILFHQIRQALGLPDLSNQPFEQISWFLGTGYWVLYLAIAFLPLMVCLGALSHLTTAGRFSGSYAISILNFPFLLIGELLAFDIAARDLGMPLQ